jgi:hypothetical protein
MKAMRRNAAALCLALAAPAAAADSFDPFWKEFQAAVAGRDFAAVADVTVLPFQLNNVWLDRAGYLHEAPKLFDAKIRRCIARAKPQADGAYRQVFCHGTIFQFEAVGGSWRFSEIGADD